jgi:hypothetical protein
MAYRGEDLDLRSPLGRGMREPYSTQEPGLNGRGRGGALYVDDTVLACCNQAFDIAQAHSNPEVQLEHLIHAMTRVDAAAEVLERRGIREGHLRRESAAAIAADIPIARGMTHTPRASTDFETVVRRATDHAANRNAAANVEDVLWVLLNYDRENPAVALLMRHALNWQQWDWPHRRERERVVERVVERVQAPAPQPQPVMPSYTAPNLDLLINRLDHIETSIRALPRDNGYASGVDHMAGRLADMENAFRGLQNEFATDRRAMTDLLRDLRREMSTRTDGGKVPSNLLERIHGVESTVQMRFDQLARSFNAVEQRIDSMPVGGSVSLPPKLMDRLDGIERTLAARPTGNADHVVHTLSERINGLEKGIAASIAERMKALDRVISSVQSNGSTGAPEEMMLVAEQLQTAAGNMQNVNDRLSALERIVAERLGGMERVATERQTTLEKRLVEQTAHMERTLGDRLIAAERNQLERLQEMQRLMTGLAERPVTAGGGDVRALQPLLDTHAQQTQATLKGALTNLAQPLIERMAQVEQNVERQQAQTTFAMNSLMEKTSTSTVEINAQHARELGELHEALVQLGQNQKTLSDSLDQWRQDAAGDLGVIGNRLATIESAGGGAKALTDQLGTLSTDLQALQRVALADYDQNRRGIRHWLFGTENIFAGSWRDDTAQLRARIQERDAPQPKQQQTKAQMPPVSEIDIRKGV